MQPAAVHPAPGSPPELTPRDREWLTLYLDCNEDLQTLATRLASLASGQQPVASRQSPLPPPSLFDLAAWLRTPAIRAALADWDYAQRRARAAHEDAGTRLAVDHLMTICRKRLDSLSYAPPAASGQAGPLSGGPRLTWDSFNSLVEVRRAATTALRALTASTRTTQHPARRSAVAERSTSHRLARPVSSSESSPAGAGRGNLTGSRTHSGSSHIAHRSSLLASLGPEDAERFLEKERRENDRLQNLIQQTLAITGDAPHPPRPGGGGSPGPRPGETEGAPSPTASSPAAPEQPDPARAHSLLRGGFTAEGSPWRRGGAPIECAVQHPPSPDRAADLQDDLDELDDIDDDAELDADPEGTLAIAQHVLRAVESGAPEAADFAPELIHAARVYVELPAAPAPCNTS